MNTAMLLAENVSWDDGLELGQKSVGGWSAQELEAACTSAFIDKAVCGIAPMGGCGPAGERDAAIMQQCTDFSSDTGSVEGTLAVFEHDGAICASVFGLPPVRLAPAGDIRADAVASALGQRIAHVRRWLYDLHEAVIRNDPTAVLEIGVRMTGLSLILFDGAFSLAAFARGPLEQSRRFEETVDRRQAVEVSADHQREYRKLMAEKPSGFATFYEEPTGSTPVWSQPVDAGSETFRLHVMGAREDDVGTISVARAIAVEIGCILRYPSRTSMSTYNADLVQELVQRQHAPAEAASRMVFFGWKGTAPWTAARVEAVDTFFPLARWRSCAFELERAIPDAHATPLDDGLALVMPAHSIDASLLQIEGFCQREGCVFCWGDPVDSLGDVFVSYAQGCLAADFALNADGPSRPGSPISYDSCKHGLLLRALGDLARSTDVVPSSLAAVRNYDEQHSGCYEQTMRAYLASDRSKVDSCAALAIHRTTLDYRLARLREEFAIDLDDSRTAELMRLVFAAGA